MAKVQTGLVMDSKLWKRVKHHCIDRETTYSVFIEDLVRDFFNKNNKKTDDKKQSKKEKVMI